MVQSFDYHGHEPAILHQLMVNFDYLGCEFANIPSSSTKRSLVFGAVSSSGTPWIVAQAAELATARRHSLAEVGWPKKSKRHSVSMIRTRAYCFDSKENTHKSLKLGGLYEAFLEERLG